MSIPNPLQAPGRDATAAQRRPRAADGARKTPARRAAAPSAGTPSSIDRIVEAAGHLFARRGYAQSTLDDVAAQAGYTKGAVYYYFKNKESLLLELLKRIEVRSIDATIDAIRQAGGSASGQLELFVKRQTGWAARCPEDLAVMMLMSIETTHTPTKVRARMRRIYRKLGGALEKIIEAGKAAREFDTGLDTRGTALYLQAVHDGNMMIWYRSGTDPEIGRKLARATLAGFAHAVRPVP